MRRLPLVFACFAILLSGGCAQPSAAPPGAAPSAIAPASAPVGKFDRAQKGKIVPGTSVEGVKLGISQAEVEKLLGKPEAVDRFSAQTYLSYYGKGLEVALNDGKVGQITCHAKKDQWQAYPGGTSDGLWVGSPRADFEKALSGERASSFPEALKYAARGLWIRFDKDGTTESVSVLKPE